MASFEERLGVQGEHNEIPFVKAGQSGRCSDREFAFVLDNLVSIIN